MLDKYLKFFDTPIHKDYFTQAKELIKTYGYTWTENDDSIFSFIVLREIEKLLNQTNRERIPHGLQEYLKSRIVSQFYNFKGNLNELTDFDFDNAIAQIQMGDTSYTFAGAGDGETAQEKFLNYLKNQSEGWEWICYRKLKW